MTWKSWVQVLASMEWGNQVLQHFRSFCGNTMLKKHTNKQTVLLQNNWKTGIGPTFGQMEHTRMLLVLEIN